MGDDAARILHNDRARREYEAVCAERDELAATLATERAEGERKDAVIEAAQALCEAHYIATSIPSRPQTINRQVWTNLQLALHDYREAQHG